ncbi:hypothetical protein LF799_000697 [Escherichia coli]|nr:hypothetical protein [Escherichia coli]
MNERLKTHSKTQKKSADLVSNKLRIGVFQRYQMKCKSVSKKSPRYMSVFLAADNESGHVQAVIAEKDFQFFERLGFVASVDELKPTSKRGRKAADNGNSTDKG